MTHADERPDKVMVIECPFCNAQFRFDRKLFKAASGASVRCRRCEGSIEVRNPDFLIPRVAPDPAPTGDDGKRGTEPRSSSTPAAAEAVGQAAPDVPPPSLPVFLKQGPKELAEIFGAGGRTGKRSHSRRRRTATLARDIGVALAFLLGLASLLWYLRLTDGERTLVRSPASTPAASVEASASGVEYEFDRVETFYQMNQREGRLFVLKGRVSRKPPYTGQGRIGVRVSVRSATNAAVAEKIVVAGALISDEVLLRGGRTEIEQAISDAAVGRSAETAPTPGGPLPFQAVFFDNIGAITSYELAAEDVK